MLGEISVGVSRIIAIISHDDDDDDDDVYMSFHFGFSPHNNLYDTKHNIRVYAGPPIFYDGSDLPWLTLFCSFFLLLPFPCEMISKYVKNCHGI